MKNREMQTNFIPSASVILLKECENKLQVLMLKKNQRITYGGSWVFPGGRIDAADSIPTSDDVYAAEKRAATRECVEETGLVIDSQRLIPISRWLTPAIRPKRFSALFFFYNANELGNEVQIDHGEIVDSRWIDVNEALTLNHRGELTLTGPSYVTLMQLSQYAVITEAINAFVEKGVEVYAPKIQIIANGNISIYREDSAYEYLTDDQVSEGEELLAVIENASNQHRLYMYEDKAWNYVVNC